MECSGFKIGLDQPFFLIAGPCVIESEDLVLEVAAHLKEVTARLGIGYIFKASFDKANRTAHSSFRGLGLEKGLQALARVKKEIGVPVLTDVHSVAHVDQVASVVDILQIPALLCRQTDLVQAAARTQLPVNIKKGQFMAPRDMQHVADKARATGNQKIMLCERGTFFGYHNLVVDMRSLAQMSATGCPVIFDATHSVQLPGNGLVSSGQRHWVPILARSAIAAGVSGVFMETHPNPDQALSDGPNSWPLDQMASLLQDLVMIDRCVKSGLQTPLSHNVEMVQE